MKTNIKTQLNCGNGTVINVSCKLITDHGIANNLLNPVLKIVEGTNKTPLEFIPCC